MRAEKGEPIKIEMLCPVDLSKWEIQALWDQGICMDDWDYLLLIDRDEMVNDGDTWEPTYPVERLLTGSCSNEWYVGTFREKECGIGIAYHS